MNLRTLRHILSPVDVVSIGFLSFLSVLNIVFASRVSSWLGLVVINTVVCCFTAGLAWLSETKRSKLLVGMHRWYCYPITVFVFKEIYLMVHAIHPVDYDQLLIAADKWIFGVNPTEWLAQFSHPIITEILQITYFSYYLLFIVLGVEIYRRYSIESFDHAAFIIVYGFYLSYLGYFIVPAVGPRFVLHDFSQLNRELPGIFLTQTLRAIIDAGESIPRNLSNPADYVQRDVFPSGHTQLSLIVLYLAFRYNLRSRWFLLVMASLLIMGTVYLRYHYVVDLFGGAFFFAVTIWTGNKIEAWWQGKKSMRHADRGSLESHDKIE